MNINFPRWFWKIFLRLFWYSLAKRSATLVQQTSHFVAFQTFPSSMNATFFDSWPQLNRLMNQDGLTNRSHIYLKTKWPLILTSEFNVANLISIDSNKTEPMSVQFLWIERFECYTMASDSARFRYWHPCWPFSCWCLYRRETNKWARMQHRYAIW